MKTRRVSPLAVIAALAAVFASPLMAVPTEIARESFEGAGGAIGFTTTVAQFDEPTVATSDFFSVILNNGTKLIGGTITGGDGASMFAAEDIDTVPGPGVGATQSVTFNPVNISGKTSTSVKILLAAPGTGPAGGGVQTFYDWSATAADIDFIRVEASVDGGPFNRLTQFSPSTQTLNQPLSLDTDGNGTGGQGTSLTAAFQEFDLPFSTGASVQIRVVMHSNATNEYLCIDNVRIFGDSPVTAPPALGGVSGTLLIFPEGGSAAALASAITVTDTDSANLASATVTISAGLASGEDVLAATPSGAILAGDIVYNSGLGRLTITRSAPLATYQTMLRSVTYRNTNVTAPSTATRNITFSASDGVNASNSPIRQVQVVDSINTQNLPFTESFETDGRGTRYALDGRFTNGNAMFDRGQPIGTTNLDGTFAIIAEDTLLDAAPVKAVAFLLNTAPFGTVSASVRLGVLGGAIYDTGDVIAIEASVNGGAFTTVAAFRSTGGASTPMALDTNNDGIGDGTQLSTAMQDFSFPMPAATTLGLRVRCQSNTAGERLIVDRIVVTGNAAPTVGTTVPDITANEDTVNGTVNLRTYFTDIENAPAGLTYTVQTNTNSGVVTTSINNSTDVLTLDYVDNLSGTANITIRATDTGGLFVEDTFLVTVNAVNDVPSFTKGADQGVLEDSGLRTVAGWATAISAGPANESGQALNFIVGNNNPSLFLLQPAIAANGTLTFTPAANANGTATVTVQIHDNGGIANGGMDTSAPQAFLINVTAVNDPPVITGQNAISTSYNTSRTIIFGDLLVTDADNTYPTGFILTVLNGTNYIHTGNVLLPAVNFFGTLSVPVKVNDGTADSNIFNLAVIVNPDPAFVKVASSIAREPGGGNRISFIGNPGQTYTIQFAATFPLSPTPIAWQFLGNRSADATGRYSIVDIPPVGTPMRFYRSIFP